jgi:hypothetical protein
MIAAVRCSTAREEADVDPIGTATSARGFLLVAWPLPWPRDAGEIDEFAPLVAPAKAAGVRIQAIVPSDGPVAVLHRRSDDGWFAGYERVLGTGADPVAAATELLAGAGTPAHEGGDGSPCDVLVCTHGRRDACCGSMGTAVALELLAPPPAGALVHRTSHLGGHRFAPTALVLPQGTCWAGVDAADLRAVTERRGALDELLPRYRGSTGIGGPVAQAVERAAFAEVGWDWLDHRRRSVEHDDGSVTVEAVAPDGTAAAWRGAATTRDYLIPPCTGGDRSGEGEAATYEELRLTEVARVA